MKVGRPAKRSTQPAQRKSSAAGARRPHEPRGLRQGPQSAPAARPAQRPARPKSTTQAKARAKARKAKSPKVIRLPLRDRIRELLLARLDGLDLRPHAMLARIPFVVLVIGALGIGLAITLWLSTASAQRSYQLGSARALNDALSQQKEALERDVLQAESAPALADAARNLGMIPSRDTAHLVLDPAGNWIVVGKPKPAEGAPPPPLNTKLPELNPAAPVAPPKPVPPPLPQAGVEVPARVLLPGSAMPPAAATEVPVRVASPTDPLAPHSAAGLTPGAAPLPGPAALPGLTILPVDPAAAPVLPVPALAPPVAPLPAAAQ